MWLTSLLLMPSASATATPLAASADPSGMQAPWKSWLIALHPASVCCPMRTRSVLAMGRSFRKSDQLALGRGLDVGGVERQAREGQAAHQIAEHHGDLVPEEVVKDRKIAAHHQARREQEHDP